MRFSHSLITPLLGALLVGAQTPAAYARATDVLQALNGGELVTCQGGERGSCPESVGALYDYEPQINPMPARCSGVLVAPDMFLTNAHCLGDLINHPEESCRGRFFVHMPETQNRGYEIHHCKRVYATSEKEAELDYALIELTTDSPRELLAMRNDGIRDKESLTAWVANPIPDSLRSIVTPRKLRNVQGSFLLNNRGQDYSPRVLLTGEEIIIGNSGSPIVDKKNQLVGIIFAIHTREQLGALFHSISKDFLDLDSLDRGVNFNYGINLSCIPEFQSHDLPKEANACRKKFLLKFSAEDAQKLKAFLAKDAEKMTLKAHEDLQKWIKSQTGAESFEWKLAPLGNHVDIDARNANLTLALPSCVVTPPSASLKMPGKLYRLGLDLNGDGNIASGYRRLDSEKVQMQLREVTPASGDERAVYEVKLNLPAHLNRETITFSLALGSCGSAAVTP